MADEQRSADDLRDTVNGKLHRIAEIAASNALSSLEAARPSDAVQYLATVAGAFEAMAKAVQYALMIHIGQSQKP